MDGSTGESGGFHGRRAAVVITRNHQAQIFDRLRREFPNEGCGLLAGTQERVTAVYPIDSAEPSPVFYNMDSKQQLRALGDIEDRGWELLAIYHSHTHTRAYPSATDIQHAVYPDALYVIVSLADESDPEMRAFRVTDGAVAEEPVVVVDEG